MAISVEEKRANRGAELLDRNYPGWEWDKSFDDLSTLAIRKADDCVLGKLYGVGNLFPAKSGYMIGCEILELGIWDNQPMDYGFAGGDEQTKAWRELITAKRAQVLSDLTDLSSEDAEELSLAVA